LLLLAACTQRQQHAAAVSTTQAPAASDENDYYVNSSTSLFNFEEYQPYVDVNPSSPLPLVFHTAVAVGVVVSPVYVCL